MSEAPDRIWITSEIMSLYSNPSCDTDEEYIRKDAACVEVKEGYEVDVYEEVSDEDGQDFRLKRPLSEALTIRTVEDVRREAISKIKKEIKDSCPNEFDEPKQKGYIKGLKTAIKLIDTPAPSREKAQPVCPDCGDTGMRDSGGVYPWGEHISVPCDHGNVQPEPDQEPVAWGESYDGGAFFNTVSLTKTRFHTFPLYTTPQPDKLRKAKAEAWDKGYRLGYHDATCEGCMVHGNPYRRSTDEGEG